MRRKDKEIAEKEQIEEIIRKAAVCHVAICLDNQPYIVPFNFGYKDNCLYFHSAREGKKMDMIRGNNNVCFEFDIGHKMNRKGRACEWSFGYQSVIGFGHAYIIDDAEEKRQGLEVIMSHYSKRTFEFLDEKIKNVVIIKIDIESITGKRSG
jgi:nitroimidazol reductase NimA-like FMN-containing flavoprotein (pyridoxamine 5'-phosphate oxidase superfamily)